MDHRQHASALPVDFLPMKFYFVRHGESEANVLGIISNRDLPHGLTAHGRTQAELLAKQLRRLEPAKIFASPILRAQQTADILAKRLRVPFSVTDALREYDCGILEGKSDKASWEQHHLQFGNWVERERWDSRTEGGESFDDMRARFVPFIESLVKQEPANANLILIGHGGIFLLMLPLVLANVTHAFALSQSFRNTAYVLAETRADKLMCVEWCGVQVL